MPVNIVIKHYVYKCAEIYHRHAYFRRVVHNSKRTYGRRHEKFPCGAENIPALRGSVTVPPLAHCACVESTGSRINARPQARFQGHHQNRPDYDLTITNHNLEKNFHTTSTDHVAAVSVCLSASPLRPGFAASRSATL